ncbi:MAG: nitrophenyl compound nitroreductase subunit ArsF family protein [Phycisphaerae bacterium]
MKAKGVISTVLLLFVAASVIYLVVDASRREPTARQPTTGQTVATASTQQAHKLVAYYFHRTQRCDTCLTIEAYAEEALRAALPEAFETGEVEWHAVNIEEPANEHFVQDYELVTSTLVLVNMRDGKQVGWRALHEVWDLVDEKDAFLAYVAKEAAAMMETGS